MAEYTGVYENEKLGQRIIQVEDDKLFSKRSTGGRFEIFPF